MVQLDMLQPYTLQIFGPIRLQIGDALVGRFPTKRGQALLSYLLLNATQVHSRISLAELLWPEQPEKQSRQNLRQTLTRMRQDLGVGLAAGALPALPDPFTGDYHTLQVDAGLFAVDALRFRALLQACAEHNHTAMDRCPICAGQLRQAVALYQGELLAGLSVEDSPAFESWLLMERELFHRQVVDALRTLIAYHRTLYEHAAVRDLAERLIALEPYDEATYVHLIEALALLGERAAALACYDRCATLLLEELGMRPSDVLQKLHAQLVRFADAKELKQALQGPSVETIQRLHFPHYLSPFFGREAELAQIVELLADPRCRLLTVTGPGGIGKSRLIVEAAQRVNALNYPNGLYFVPLASLTQPEEVIRAIADALSIPPDEGGKLQNQLARALAKQRLLLVLDNFEQLMEAVPLLMDLLSAAPALTCLVSSRQPLQVEAERQLPLGGLAYPTEKDQLLNQPPMSALFGRYSALAFFVERARHIAPAFTPTGEDWPAIVQICRLVQGMPLAITMAASWLSIYDCATIAAQISHNLDLFQVALRDLPKRHQNLRATFEVSWQLLPVGAQKALARLAVMRGAFTRAAAEQVTQVSPADLAYLVTHALVTRVSADRFVLHELLRQFAAEKLDQLGEREDARRAHSRYYLGLWAAEETNLIGKDQHQSIARLHEDALNLSAAWLAAGYARDWLPLHKSLAAFEHYWSVTGMHAEGRRLAAAIEEHLLADLAQSERLTDVDEGGLSLVEKRMLLARLQLVQGMLLRSHAPLSDTLAVLHKALATASDLPESASDLVGQIHLNLSANYNYQGSSVKWEKHLDLANQRLQDSTDHALRARLYVELSVQAGNKGDLPGRIELLKQAVRLAEQSGDLSIDFYARGFLVFIQTRWGDFSEMFHHVGIILDNARLVQNVLAEARALNFAAGYYFHVGDWEQMTRYHAQALPLFEQIGDPVHLAILYVRRVLHALFVADLPRAIALAQQAIQSGLTNQHMILESIASTLLGRAYVQTGDLASAWDAFARAMRVASTQGNAQEGLQAVLGQSMIRLVQGEAAAARQALDPYLPTILSGSLAGLIDYDHIYADAYRILRAANDPCAGQLLARGHAVFSRIADTIANEVHRRSYWQSNPARRFVAEEIGRLEIGDWRLEIGD